MARQNIFGEILAEPHNSNYKKLFDKVFQLSGAVNPIGEQVYTLDELIMKHPNPTVGDAAYVIDDKIVYRWNGKEWEYFSDFTILDDVINDVDTARENTELATDNANTAVVNAYQKIGEMDTLKNTLNTDENIRQTNENNRKTAESGRSTAESGRASAEDIRVTSESTRTTSESSRVSAETGRKTAESSRVSAEGTRNTKETERLSAENIRISNENTRKSDEAVRTQSESTRVSNESGRVSAESARVSAENIRKTSENTRVTNEDTRAINEDARIQRMQELEEIDAVILDTKINNHKNDGVQHGKIARFIIGTSAAGWTNKDCDYLCDGVNDNIEINQAIGELPTAGGEVVLLDGEYEISSRINMRNNIVVSGRGNNTVLKRNWSSSQNEGVIHFLDAGNSQVTDVSIDNDPYIGFDNCGIYMSNSKNNIIERVYFSDASMGIVLRSQSNYNKILNNMFASHSASELKTCVHMYDSSYNIISSNSNIYNSTGTYNWGVAVDYSSHNTISNNVFTNLLSTGVDISSGFESNPMANKNIVTGNILTDNNVGIAISGRCKFNIVSGNICMRGEGTPSDYGTFNETIRVAVGNGFIPEYNSIQNNNCMGKNVVSVDVNGTVFNNKWNDSSDFNDLRQDHLSHKADMAAQLASKAGISMGASYEASLANGWTGQIQYSKNAFGMVWLRGQVVPGTQTEGTQIAYLPAEYAPRASYVPLIGFQGGAQVCRVGFVLKQSNSHLAIQKPASGALNTGQGISFDMMYQSTVS